MDQEVAEMVIRIDKHSNIPLYAQLKDALVAGIRAGRLGADGRIPSEIEICDMTLLSRPTVRQAVAELVAEGVLVKVKGKGTYLAERPESIELKGFNGFQFSVLASDSQETREFRSIDRIEGESDELDRIFGQMPLSTDKAYARMTWVIQEKDAPYAHCVSYVPLWMFPNLIDDLRLGRRMLDITANKYAFLPTRTHLRLEVRSASPEESESLDIARGQAVIVATSDLSSRSGNLCEHVVAVLRSDRCAIVQDAGRN